MIRALRLTLLGLAVVAVLTGCGGGGGAHYSAAATKSCIKAEDPVAEISEEDADYIAQAAAERGYAVDVFGEFGDQTEFGDLTVNMAFERTDNDARRTEASYKAFAGVAGDVPTSDVLFRVGNVVVSWDAAPTDKVRSVIEDCLREGGTP